MNSNNSLNDRAALLEDFENLIVMNGDINKKDAVSMIKDAPELRQGEISVNEEELRNKLTDSIRYSVAIFNAQPEFVVNGIMNEIRPYLGTRKPVSVSLEKCIDALQPFLPQPPLYCDEPNRKLYTDNHIKAAKAVLDAAGVSYVD